MDKFCVKKYIAKVCDDYPCPLTAMLTGGMISVQTT